LRVRSPRAAAPRGGRAPSENSVTGLYIRCVFRTSGAARTAIGQYAGLILLIAPQQTPVDARISLADFSKLLAAKTVAVVDTRSDAEFTRGHVPGAISLTAADLSARTAGAVRAIAALKKSKLPIVVYCACPAELTSLRVAEALRAEGLADARALTGGWVEWFNAGNPVEPGR
jgi:rhodanese-related sulfurtransferase